MLALAADGLDPTVGFEDIGKIGESDYLQYHIDQILALLLGYRHSELFGNIIPFTEDAVDTALDRHAMVSLIERNLFDLILYPVI